MDSEHHFAGGTHAYTDTNFNTSSHGDAKSFSHTSSHAHANSDPSSHADAKSFSDANPNTSSHFNSNTNHWSGADAQPRAGIDFYFLERDL
ncbi:MAG TPA: hypothetical protein VN904_02905 [Chthoniobacterales bacterium]|nr:hypothetical protein [Chthoniobacterales bacterium]